MTLRALSPMKWNDLQNELATPGAIDIANLTQGQERLELSGYLPLLVQGAGMTIFLSLTSFALAMLIGLIICTMRLYGPPGQKPHTNRI